MKPYAKRKLTIAEEKQVALLFKSGLGQGSIALKMKLKGHLVVITLRKLGLSRSPEEAYKLAKGRPSKNYKKGIKDD